MSEVLQLHTGLFYKEAISFYVIDSPRHEIILGFILVSPGIMVSWLSGLISA